MTDRRDTTGNGRDIDRRTILKGMGAGVGLAAVSGEALALEAGVVGDGSNSGLTTAELAAARTRATATQREAVVQKADCFTNEREIFGPTDINAQTANGRLAVALNDAATMTVFRWPRPSFYDQIKYYTLGRNEDSEIRVLANEGAFLGLRKGDGGTTWLRDWNDVDQHYANDLAETATDSQYSDEVVTTFSGPPADSDLPPNLSVTVRDVVPPDEDALVRDVTAIRPGSASDDVPTDLQLVAFENFNLVNSKHVQNPTHDWCSEETNQDRARYIDRHDAIVHTLDGVDESTGERQSIAVAMGFADDSTAHQIGGDAHEPAAEPTGEAGPTRDAYDAATAGTFPGNDEYAGQTTGALVTDLAFQPVVTGKGQEVEQVTAASATVVIGADHTVREATTVLGTLRNREVEDVRAAKERWIADELADAPLPDAETIDDEKFDREAIMNLARRALVTLVTTYDRHRDPETGALVASIATQPPYGQDWPRDSAFFNFALSLIGHHDKVETRDRWYADIQQALTDPRPTHPNTPPGNWAMVYYADGVAGGPVPYEIDETGYATWMMWDHFEVTGDEEYLRAVYPAIRRAGDFLVRCRNPRTGLHCRATWEDDNFFDFTPSIVGASVAWLGLKAAAQAAEELERTSDAARFRERQHELGQAIDRETWDEEEGAYGTNERLAMGEVTWPVCFTPYAETDPDPDADSVTIHDTPQVDDPLEHPRIQDHLDTGWESVSACFTEPNPDNDIGTGQYEVKTLIPLAKARRDSGPGSIDQVREGIDWIATQHATPDTHIMGEAWKVFEDAEGNEEVRSIIGQPHVWEQTLTYLAALEAWPPIDADGNAAACDTVLEELRRENA